jgi:hypothetical protein
MSQRIRWRRKRIRRRSRELGGGYSKLSREGRE